MTLTPEQIQVQAAAIRGRSSGESRVVALRHSGGWSGPERLTVAGEEHLVLCCVSDLQMREALGRLEAENKPGILLCEEGLSGLGEDVLARLTKRSIQRPQRDEILRELFSARVVDGRILASFPLAEALIGPASAGGYPPAPGGTLDLDLAWKALLRKTIEIEISEVSFTELMRWTMLPSARGGLTRMDPKLRQELARWLSPAFGEAPRQLFHALETEVGADLVAVGLLMGLVLSAERAGVGEAQAAAARLEQYFGNESPDSATRQTWYQSATELYRRLAQSEAFQAQAVIQNLDRLIERVRLQSQAQLSDYSRTGLELRIARAGEAIQRALETNANAETALARAALGQAAQHQLVAHEELRLRRLEMALRLVLWLRVPSLPGPEAVLSQLVAYYQAEGGFVDWARDEVAESDPIARVKEALRVVLESVDQRWTPFQRRFAERLQQWSVQDAELNGALRIEHVLWSVVAPVARQHPVLWIVLDGMSQAVFRELETDLLRRNWVEVAAPAADTPRAVLAAIPSITEISRRALLSGQLPVAAEGTEKGDFSKSDRLSEQAGGQVRPQLFLKGDLLESGRMELAAAVTAAIANSRCRLVGVVVNAVDDSLGSADQASYTWGLDQIAPLHQLMRAASESGRVVILASDHGHVLDEGSHQVRQPLPETGDRYRLPAGPLNEGELEFRGPRIKAAVGSESIVVLAGLSLRYQGRRRGYHGGVCPGEMVVPCVVLRGANTRVPDMWEDLPPYEPEWWSLRAEVAAVIPVRSEGALPPRRTPHPKQPDLFLPQESARNSSADWVDRLIASPTYLEQTRAAVRGAPPSEQLRRFLMLLEQRNWRILRGHLAQQLGMPLIRVDGMIQNYRRLLNVDGYDVLSYDQASESVVLNQELLKSQFGI